jgi:hypothetical protein
MNQWQDSWAIQLFWDDTIVLLYSGQLQAIASQLLSDMNLISLPDMN